MNSALFYQNGLTAHIWTSPVAHTRIRQASTTLLNTAPCPIGALDAQPRRHDLRAVRLFRQTYTKRRAKARVRMLRRSSEGRELGWFLEHRGVRLARLTEPNYFEMFWVQYRVTPMPAVSWETLANPNLWVTSASTAFRNAGTGDAAQFAFQGGRLPSPEWPHVTMRALYVECPPRWLRDYEWWEERPVVGAIVLAVLLLALTSALRECARELFRLTIVN